MGNGGKSSIRLRLGQMYREAYGRMDGWTSRGQLGQQWADEAWTGCWCCCCSCRLASPYRTARPSIPIHVHDALRRLPDDANIDYLYIYTVAVVACCPSVRQSVLYRAGRCQGWTVVAGCMKKCNIHINKSLFSN